MSAQLAVALLALTSLCVASEPDCEELVKPLVLDSHSPIYGKWVLHVASWDQPGLKKDLATVKSSWVDLSASTDNGVMTIYWADRVNDDKCLQGVANATITGMTSHTTFNINGHTSYHDGKYYESCAECLLSEDTTLLPDGETKGRYLFLFTVLLFFLHLLLLLHAPTRALKMYACVAVLLLALTPLCVAFAPDCEELVKPFFPEDPNLVFGKWVYVMGSGDPMPYRKALDPMKSSWIELSPTEDSQLVTLRWGDHCFNRCIYGEVNATVSEVATTFRIYPPGSTVSIASRDQLPVIGTLRWSLASSPPGWPQCYGCLPLHPPARPLRLNSAARLPLAPGRPKEADEGSRQQLREAAAPERSRRHTRASMGYGPR
ncbi:hypothetical protein NHX12_029343 [Muraenolepis orangiensis]|uniref:Uncharacterized protein n=1 Tax=Muraenolepis orangiensis TaxID=630683 RepID=A0A9Q0INJ4_9TELE|nr:hypothetical protein NHX12_029343 [Muraenolepis orangiensis]